MIIVVVLFFWGMASHGDPCDRVTFTPANGIEGSTGATVMRLPMELGNRPIAIG